MSGVQGSAGPCSARITAALQQYGVSDTMDLKARPKRSCHCRFKPRPHSTTSALLRPRVLGLKDSRRRCRGLFRLGLST